MSTSDVVIRLSPQDIVFLATLVGALCVLVGHFAKGVRWFDRQSEQDNEINSLEHKHDEDMQKIQMELEKEIATIKKEQAILTFGLLACLKGLQEKGCNGPVTEAISKLETHLNKSAHNIDSLFS